MIPLVGWEEKVLVTLTPEEWSQDEAITNAQQERRIAMGHVHGNSRNITREEALLLHFMAMHGERAVHKLFPWLEWHNEVVDYPTGLPDLGNFVDVKAPDQDPTSKIPRRLIAYDNQLHKDWAYVLALFVGLRRFRIMEIGRAHV